MSTHSPDGNEKAATATYFILLSARKERVLRTMIEELLTFVELEGDRISDLLPRMAYTLQTGREQMQVRCVIEASSLEELIRNLSHLRDSSRGSPIGVDTRKVEKGEKHSADDDERVEQWLRAGDFHELSCAWLNGAEINWRSLYGTDHPTRVNLPTYPFDNQRYWITESRGKKTVIAPGSRAEDETKAQTASLSAGFSQNEQEHSRAKEGARRDATTKEHRIHVQDARVETSPGDMTGAEKRDAKIMTDQTNSAGPQPSLRDLQIEVSEGLAAALYMDVDDVDLDETFFELGVESVSGVEWIKSLNEQYKLNLKVSAIYDAPTLRTFSALIHEQICARQGEEARVGEPAGVDRNHGSSSDARTEEIAEPSAPNARSSEHLLDADLLERRILEAAAARLMIDVDNLSVDSSFENMGFAGTAFSKFISDVTKDLNVGHVASTLTADRTPTQMSLLVRSYLETGSVAPQHSRLEPDGHAPPDIEQVEPPTVEIARRVEAAATGKEEPEDAIAIIGMAGQFPMASNAEEFWANLIEGRDCITEIPYDRWGDEGEGKSFGYPHTGVLECADQFDPLFFSISPKEARLMEPQQRVFLQNCWSCIEDAGYAPSSLGGSKCGVFAGCSGAGYGVGRIGEASTHALMGHTTSILPARISYHLDLKGPCMSVDTACSSSLVAISQACTSLVFGGCDLALAGGVSVFASPLFSMMAAEGGMLSEDGRCFTFDNRANGFVPSEGVGVFLLKRLRDAEADGDRIHGVVRGWGVNHDGKTNGMTAPSVVSQTELECEIYDRFSINPESINYVEAHGTGTSLGDPIEVQGLTDAFKRYTKNKNYCALGSVKSNIGHALAAAGAAGVMKVLLSLENETLPPTINYKNLNDEIDLDDSAFFINDRARPWLTPERGVRRAAVSSFSYNGTNAHLVIEEYPSVSNQTIPAHSSEERELLLLSGRNPKQLRRQAENLIEHLTGMQKSNRETISDIAYTLQVGRDPMHERLGFIATSISEALECLRSFLRKEDSVRCVFGNVRKSKRSLDRESDQDRKRRQNTVDRALTQGDLDRLLALWMEGTEVDWSKLHRRQPVSRISLPTYPFEPSRYWLDGKGPPNVSEISSEQQVAPGRSVASDAGEMTQRFEKLLEQAAAQ